VPSSGCCARCCRRWARSTRVTRAPPAG
jgi:hypothetical protein